MSWRLGLRAAIREPELDAAIARASEQVREALKEIRRRRRPLLATRGDGKRAPAWIVTGAFRCLTCGEINYVSRPADVNETVDVTCGSCGADYEFDFFE